MLLIIVVILLILLLGGGVAAPQWGYSYPQYGGGVLGLIVIILVLLWATGNLGRLH